MGLYDTIQCDYPLPDPRLQDAELRSPQKQRRHRAAAAIVGGETADLPAAS